MFNNKLQPKANDIIVLYNFALKQEYHYFVLEEYENGYKCVPLNIINGFYEALPYELTIAYDTIILKVFKTPEIMCHRLLEQLQNTI